MDLDAAWRLLGIDPTTDAEAARSAFVARLHLVHPDHSPAPDANSATAELTTAYRVVQADLALGATAAAGSEHPAEEPPAADLREVVPIAMVDGDTLAVALPAGETYALLVEAAHRLGEVTHIEPSAGLLMVIVEFIEAPTCQLLCTLQGRATGVTEIFCTIESLEQEPPPPVAAVVELLLAELVAVSRTPAR